MIRSVLAVVLLSGGAAAQETIADFPNDIACYVHHKSRHEGERARFGDELKRRGHTCSPSDVAQGHDSFVRWRQAGIAKQQQGLARETARQYPDSTPPPQPAPAPPR